MNSKKRRTYSDSFLRFFGKQEKAFVGPLQAALRITVKNVIKILEERGAEAAKNYLRSYLYEPKLADVLGKLFRSMALSQANRTYRELYPYVKEFKRTYKMKALSIGQLISDISGAFGFNPEWNADITQYLQQFLLKRAVLPVTETVKKGLMKVITTGQDNGWGIERIKKELENTKITEVVNAERIVRTELVKASSFGHKMAKDKLPFETTKQWITCRDHRVRKSHVMMDGKQVDSDADFHVPIVVKGAEAGVDLMTGPGDPEASARNIIQCRCTLAYIPKRNKQGRLIPLNKTKIA